MEELFSRELVEKNHKINHSIWVGISMCLLVYLALCLERRQPGQATVTVNFFTLLMSGMAASLLFIGFRTNKPKLVANLELTEEGVTKLFKRFRWSKVISLAMFEATAMYGFILCLTGNNLIVVFMLFGAALLAMLTIRPTQQALEEYIARNLAAIGEQNDQDRDSLYR